MDSETYHKIRAAEDTLWFYLGRRAIVHKLIEAFYGPLAICRHLDIGCGSGGTLYALGGRTALSVGTDVARQALGYSRERGLTHLVQGDAMQLGLADGSFDLVTALDVIEHCADDDAALREIFRLLAPGGMCCLTAPALMILWSNLDHVNQHFRRYSAPGLRAKARRAGFYIRKVSYANTWLFPGILGARLIQRALQTRADGASALDFAMPFETINRLLTYVFSSESGWLAHFDLPIGSSVVAVLQRPSAA